MSPPRKRLAVAAKQGTVLLFVTVPNGGGAADATDSPWENGFHVRVLEFTNRGEIVLAPAHKNTKFESFQHAAKQCGPLDSMEEHIALFGALLLDKWYVLVAQRTEVALELPFGRVVHRVAELKWLCLSIPQVPRLHLQDRDVRRLKEFLTNGAAYQGFYYCDEADLTMPFPFLRKSPLSPCGVAQPAQRGSGNNPSSGGVNRTSVALDLQCDWSEHLRRPFYGSSGGGTSASSTSVMSASSAAVHGCCSMLIRGFVGEQRLGMHDGQILRMQLIGRQNHLNPGPRYFGRGLNHANAVGNDHVYELVIWRYVADSDDDDLWRPEVVGTHAENDDSRPTSPTKRSRHPGGGGSPQLSPRRRSDAVIFSDTSSSPNAQRMHIQFVRHTILRGTIPVHWTTEIPVGIGEATMHFDADPNKVYAGSTEYFSHVFDVMEGYIHHDEARRRRRQPLPVAVDSREGASAEGEGIPTEAKSPPPPPAPSLRCINMLRQSSNPSEEALTRHFIGAVRKAVGDLEMLRGLSFSPLITGSAASSTPSPLIGRDGGGASVTRRANAALELAHVDYLNLVRDLKSNDAAIHVFWQNVVPFLAAVNHGSSGNGRSGSTTGGGPGLAVAQLPASAAASHGVVLESGLASWDASPTTQSPTSSPASYPVKPSHTPPPLTLSDPHQGAPSLPAAVASPSAASFESPLVTAGTLSRSGTLHIATTQHNFIRVNCADSLDRTNLGCFFTCAQVVLEMLEILKVRGEDFVDDEPIDSNGDWMASAGLNGEDGRAGGAGAGDETLASPPPTPSQLAIPDEFSLFQAPNAPPTSGGASSYQSPTTPQPPAALLPNSGGGATATGNEKKERKGGAAGGGGTRRGAAGFRFPFVNCWADMRDAKKHPPAVVRALSELFVHNGDTVAMMYTNSAALHSNVIRGLSGMKLAKSNAVISAQRRYENVFEDKKKMRHLELLLGRNQELHLPSLSVVFTLRPLPFQLWATALVVTGVPKGTTVTDIQSSLRDLWDDMVVPHFAANAVSAAKAHGAPPPLFPTAAATTFGATPPPSPLVPASTKGESKMGGSSSSSSSSFPAKPSLFPSGALLMQVFIEEGVQDEKALSAEGFLSSNSSVVFARTETLADGDGDDGGGAVGSFVDPNRGTSASLVSIPSVGNTSASAASTTTPSSVAVSPVVTGLGGGVDDDGDDGGDGFCDAMACDFVAVVEFDEEMCTRFDIVRLILEQSTSLSLCKSPHTSARLSRYEYPIERTEKSGSLAESATGAVKKAAASINASLKSGFKNLIRGLN